MNKFNIGDKVLITGGNIYGSKLSKGEEGVVEFFYKQANTENYRYAILRNGLTSTYPEDSLAFKKEKPKRKELLKRIEQLENTLSLVEETATIVRNKPFEDYRYKDGVEDVCDLILTIIKKE